MTQNFETLYEMYKNPANKGFLKKYTNKGECSNLLCGDKIEIFLIVKNDTIKEAKFKGYGCVISQASASLLTDFVKNKKIDNIMKLERKDMEKLIDYEVSAARVKCLMCCLIALKKTLSSGKEKNAKNKQT